MSRRIETALEVLAHMRALHIKTPESNARTLRSEATENVRAAHDVTEQTVFAHLVGKNISNTLIAQKFDHLAQNWLENTSDKLEEWYLRDANPSDTKRIHDFFCTPNATPEAADLSEPDPARRLLVKKYRVLRDTALSRRVKAKQDNRCQLCGTTIKLGDDRSYAEAHHVKPLGRDHNGPDIRENILCVCPNCHVLLDYGAVALNSEDVPEIESEYIDYHNSVISNRSR